MLSEIREKIDRGEFQIALNLIEQNGKNETEVLLLEVEIYREIGKYQEAESLLETVQQRKMEDKELLQFYVENAYLNYRLLKINKAENYISEIRMKFQSIDELDSKIAKIYFVKSYSIAGNLEWRKSNFDQMKNYYEKALELAKSINHPYSILHSMIGLGNVSKIKGNFLLSLNYYEKGLEYAILVQNLKFEAYCRNNLGEIFQLLGRIDDAIEQFQLADDYFSKEKSIGPMSVTALNLGLCHYIINEDSLAISFFKKALKLSKEVHYKHQIWDVYIYLLLLKNKNINSEEINKIHSELSNIFSEEKDEHIQNMRKLVEAIGKVNQQSLKSKVEAQISFEKLIKKPFASVYKLLIITFLIEIKIDEYTLYRQSDDLKKITTLIDSVLNQETTGILFRIRIYMLKAKLYEMQNKYNSVQETLKEAFQVAEEFKLINLQLEIIENIERIKQLNSSYSKFVDDTLNIDQDVIDKYLNHLRRNFKF